MPPSLEWSKSMIAKGAKRELAMDTYTMTKIWNGKNAILRVGSGVFLLIDDLLYIVVVPLTVNCVLF